MRALAIGLVLVSHAGLGNAVPGGTGVTIFFSISGFIITYIVLRERDLTGSFHIGNFYMRRLLKLVPPSVVAIGGGTVIYAVTHPISPGAVSSQFLFFWNWLIAFPHHPYEVARGSAIVWSLAIEEQFYIGFALLWTVLRRKSYAERALCWCAVAAVVICNLLRVLLIGHADRIYYGTDTRIDAIALGMLCALLYRDRRHSGQMRDRVLRWTADDRTPAIAAVVILISLVIRVPWFRETVRYLMQSLAACAFLLYGLQADDTPVRRRIAAVLQSRVAQAVGLASYSIYIVHDVLFHALIGPLAQLPKPARVVVLVAVALVAGFALYAVVEIPFARLRARLHRRADSATGP